jgi:hypothetical protein
MVMRTLFQLEAGQICCRTSIPKWEIAEISKGKLMEVLMEKLMMINIINLIRISFIMVARGKLHVNSQ